MQRKIDLQKWALSVADENLTADPVAHPLWIFMKNILFEDNSGRSFSDEEIYNMVEKYCDDEYYSLAIYAKKDRYVHVDARRPIREVVPRDCLDLLLATEDLGGTHRRYFLCLYPYIRQGIRGMGKLEPGFQTTLMELATESHAKVARLLKAVEDAPLMTDKEMKKNYSLLVRAATCLKFRTTHANFDSFRSKLVCMVVLSIKTKHPTERAKNEFRNWKTQVIKELDIC